MCLGLNTTDEERVVVVEDAEGDATVASPGDSPAGEVVSERLRRRVPARGESRGDELGDRGRDFV